MLQPEQKKTLQELMAYLQDKPVGSVEFIAFSDFLETKTLGNRVRVKVISAETYALVSELARHEIERSMSMIPGYYQANDIIEKFYRNLAFGISLDDPLTEGTGMGEKEAIGFFSTIQEEIYEEKLEKYSRDFNDENDNNEEAHEDTQTS